MDPYELLIETEEKGREENELIYKKVYEELMNIINIQFRTNYTKYADIVRDIKDRYIYTSKYNELFFNILEKYNYHMEHEILDALYDIVHEDNNKNKSKIIKKYLLSPIINDISLEDNSTIKIYSTLGDYNFILANKYFKDNKKIIKLLNNGIIKNRCHDNTLFLSSIFKDYYSITSKCRSYFTGRYYHSYTYDEESDLIIDLCRKSLIKKEDFDRLYEPIEISKTKNSKVLSEIKKIDKEIYLYDICMILRIALYNECKEKEKKLYLSK